MVDGGPARTGRLTIVIAQVLLVVAAGALWVASRVPWVVIRSFDGLGPAREVTLSGASWSTALLPLALVMVATAIAALAVRGWPLRVLAVLLAATGLAVAYLGVSLRKVPHVAMRGADLAHVPVETLAGSERHYWGAGIAVAAAACSVIAAGLLMRSASIVDRSGVDKYAAPGSRRSKALREGAQGAMLEGPETPKMSERMIWDALDEGHDPTERPGEPDTEGR